LFTSQFEINIENVVASANLHQNIDLQSIARAFPTVEYKPDQFPGLVYRLKKPSTAVLVFSTGKLIVAGAKSESRAKRAVLKLVAELKTGGIVILGKPEVTIRNVVASADLGYRVDLEDAATNLEGTIYEPDQFPGLIYRQKDPKAVVLIFASGKLVCTGASHEADVERAVNKLHETLTMKGLTPSDIKAGIALFSAENPTNIPTEAEASHADISNIALK
jgi:transcription initiation factor TFIID TATA-box-binding protein